MKKDDIFEFFRRLAEENPSPETELESGNTYQLLVAVVLSAQSTDVGVNKATRALFREVTTPAQMVELGEEVFHMPVRIGYPKYDGPLADVVCEPRYANAMGLVMEGAAQKRRGIQARQTRNVGQVFSKMRSWFERNF